MGDRANLCIKSNDGAVFLYTHWRGSELRDVLATGLERGRSRWGDTPYLARIIFCELVKNSVDGETGYGISPGICDNQVGRRILVVDDRTGIVGLARPSDPTIPFESVTYEEFLADPSRLPWR